MQWKRNCYFIFYFEENSSRIFDQLTVWNRLVNAVIITSFFNFRCWFYRYISWRSNCRLDCCSIWLVSNVYLYDIIKCFWCHNFISSCSLSTCDQTFIGIIVLITQSNCFVECLVYDSSFFFKYDFYLFLSVHKKWLSNN